jgi:hypothetical protein
MQLIILVLVVAYFGFHVNALKDGIHPLVVDYNEFYYYKHLRHKMTESLSISNCTVGGDVAIGTAAIQFHFYLIIRSC